MIYICDFCDTEKEDDTVLVQSGEGARKEVFICEHCITLCNAIVSANKRSRPRIVESERRFNVIEGR